MKEKILEEITEYCSKCTLKGKCPEEECALHRIEQIVLGKQSESEEVIEGQTTVYDYL